MNKLRKKKKKLSIENSISKDLTSENELKKNYSKSIMVPST